MIPPIGTTVYSYKPDDVMTGRAYRVDRLAPETVELTLIKDKTNKMSLGVKRWARYERLELGPDGIWRWFPFYVR
jgi:hypothetical protein